MKVLFVVHQFFPEFAGGTESVTLGIAKTLQKAGHTVRVLSCSIKCDPIGEDSVTLPDAQDIVFDGVPITLISRVQAPITADFSLDVESELVSNLARWYRTEKFDVIHCTHAMRMVSALIAADQLNIPVVLTLTDFFLPCYRINLVNLNHDVCSGPALGKQCGSHCKTPPWTEAGLIQRYDVARSLLSIAVERVVPSNFLAEKFRTAFPELSFRVIPHGLDVLSRLTAQCLDYEPAFQSANAFHLAFVGTIVPQKGLHVLIQALSKMKSLNLKLSVAGPFGSDSAYENKIREMVRRDLRIELLGPLIERDVSRLFIDTDLLCLPSQVPESFSLTLREAAVFGVPALTSDLGAQSEFIWSTQAGETAIASDANDWARKLDAIIADPDQITKWKSMLPIPIRIEEETFLYQSLYQYHRSSSI